MFDEITQKKESKFYEEQADFIIVATITDNLFWWLGLVVDALPGAGMPPGKIVVVQRKIIKYMADFDLRKTFQIAKMFQRIISQESNRKIHLRLLKPNGSEIVNKRRD